MDDDAWIRASDLVKEVLKSQPHLTSPMTPNANTGKLVAEFITGMHAEIMAYEKKRPQNP